LNGYWHSWYSARNLCWSRLIEFKHAFLFCQEDRAHRIWWSEKL
jgi:hypothetical protein